MIQFLRKFTLNKNNYTKPPLLTYLVQKSNHAYFYIETQVVLPLLKSDLYHVMKACCKGALSTVSPIFDTQHTTVAVVCASGGYPGPIVKGKTIAGLDVVQV